MDHESKLNSKPHILWWREPKLNNPSIQSSIADFHVAHYIPGDLSVEETWSDPIGKQNSP